MAEKNQKLLRIVEILLGVVIGVLLALSVVRYRENHRLLSAKYEGWQKLNLILDEIERN